jgi:L-lactate dehydrogenase complex protein LldG
MNSREKILGAISINKPALIELPIIDIKSASNLAVDWVDQFIKTLESIGGKVIHLPSIDSIKLEIQQAKLRGEYIVNTLPILGEVNNEINPTMEANLLESIDRAYIEGSIGVAENGSVWLYEHQIKNRLLPFICQHLVICLNINKIVPNMHEAYQQVDVAKEGYGVFLAGPSKTADIEQSLVIGAHGARSLLVYLISE